SPATPRRPMPNPARSRVRSTRAAPSSSRRTRTSVRSSTPVTLKLDKRALFAQLGYTPHEGQQCVHASRAPRRALVCGDRCGKSLAAGMEALAAALEPRKRCMGWLVAPTMDLSEKVFREVVMAAAEHLPHRILDLKQHDKRIVLRNLGGGVSEVRGKTADN